MPRSFVVITIALLFLAAPRFVSADEDRVESRNEALAALTKRCREYRNPDKLEASLSQMEFNGTPSCAWTLSRLVSPPDKDEMPWPSCQTWTTARFPPEGQAYYIIHLRCSSLPDEIVRAYRKEKSGVGTIIKGMAAACPNRAVVLGTSVFFQADEGCYLKLWYLLVYNWQTALKYDCKLSKRPGGEEGKEVGEFTCAGGVQVTREVLSYLPVKVG